MTKIREYLKNDDWCILSNYASYYHYCLTRDNFSWMIKTSTIDINKIDYKYESYQVECWELFDIANIDNEMNEKNDR